MSAPSSAFTNPHVLDIITERLLKVMRSIPST